MQILRCTVKCWLVFGTFIIIQLWSIRQQIEKKYQHHHRSSYRVGRTECPLLFQLCFIIIYARSKCCDYEWSYRLVTQGKKYFHSLTINRLENIGFMSKITKATHTHAHHTQHMLVMQCIQINSCFFIIIIKCI